MSWASSQLASLDLGDKRLNRRAIVMCEKMIARPESTVNATFDNNAATQAAYRLLNNEDVTFEKVTQALQEACLRQLDSKEMLLVVQDTTAFDFGSHPATTGLGPTSSKSGGEAAGHGFFLHSALAVSLRGVPLGIVHQQVNVRKASENGSKHDRKQRPIEEKESYRWIQTSAAVRKATEKVRQPVVQIADREADIIEMLAEARDANSHVLIRAAHNRAVTSMDDEQRRLLRQVLDETPFSASFDLPIGRRGELLPRSAQLSLRWQQLDVQLPKHGVHSKELKPPRLTVVEVVETGEPPESCEPISWTLWTDLPITDFESARECLRLYSLRWLVERYHFTLKSGCKFEQSQLHTGEALQRLLGLCAVVALRLLQMTYLARVDGEQPCTGQFTSLEWQLLFRYYNRHAPMPKEPPSLHQAVTWVARLGGFWARKADGEPGLKVLWWGLTRLHDMVISQTLDLPPQDVCKA